MPIQQPNILANIDKFVKDEIQKGEIPSNARMAVIGTVDQNGVQIVAAVELSKNPDDFSLKIKAIFEQEWDGDRVAGAKVIFSR